MGLNLSNEQIAQELDLDKDDVHQMTSQLRQGIVDKKPEVYLEGKVEYDEVCVAAGHKGHPEAVDKKSLPLSAAEGTHRTAPRLKGERGRGTLAR
jgi:hypothetical protein